MAMCKLAPGITEIEGRQGGTIWRYDVCGQHAQSEPRLISHSSDKQIKVRRAFSRCLNFIKTHATPSFVTLWQQYANRHPKINKKGETTTLTWHQAFMSYNIPRVLEDKPIEEFPPN